MTDGKDAEETKDGVIHAFGERGTPHPLLNLRNVLLIAVFAFLATKVLTYENYEILRRCSIDSRDCIFYYSIPCLGIFYLTIVFFLYARIVFAPTPVIEAEQSPVETPSRLAASLATSEQSSASGPNSHGYLSDVGILALCLCSLQFLNSSFPIIPDKNAQASVTSKNASLTKLSKSLNQFLPSTITTPKQSSEEPQNDSSTTNFAKDLQLFLEMNFTHKAPNSWEDFAEHLTPGSVLASLFFLAVGLRIRQVRGVQVRTVYTFDFTASLMAFVVATLCYFDNLEKGAYLTCFGMVLLVFYFFIVPRNPSASKQL